MRLLWLIGLLLAPAFAGCLDADSLFRGGELRNCDEPKSYTLYFGPGLSLEAALPDTGRTPGNGFDEAFLTNDLDEWMSLNFDRTWRVTGDVEVRFWTQGINTPAPIMIGGEPGEGYHFFNQFGTNRGFVESYAIEYAPATPDDEIRKYTQTFTMPEGGMLVEEGDYLRLLLTNLVADDPETGHGPDILWGEQYPSSVTYQATCEPTPSWAGLTVTAQRITIIAHQGLLTGAIPAQQTVNYADVSFTLEDPTDRLTIMLAGAGALAEPKSDVDITVLNATGESVWSIGSPYTNEVGTRWRANLDALMPPGDYTVRVASYSGHAYSGTVTVMQDQRA